MIIINHNIGYGCHLTWWDSITSMEEAGILEESRSVILFTDVRCRHLSPHVFIVNTFCERLVQISPPATSLCFHSKVLTLSISKGSWYMLILLFLKCQEFVHTLISLSLSETRWPSQHPLHLKQRNKIRPFHKNTPYQREADQRRKQALRRWKRMQTPKTFTLLAMREVKVCLHIFNVIPLTSSVPKVGLGI